MDSSSMAQSARSTTDQPFRLLHLPPEIQLLVYEKYFEGTRLGTVLLQYDNDSHKMILSGMPSLNIELANRRVSADARWARNKYTTDSLRIWDEDFLFHHTHQFCTQPSLNWLRSHITTLKVANHDHLVRISAGRISPWDAILDACPKLKNVRLSMLCETDTMSASTLLGGGATLEHAVMTGMSHHLDGYLDRLAMQCVTGFGLRVLVERLHAKCCESTVSMHMTAYPAVRPIRGEILADLCTEVSIGKDKVELILRYCTSMFGYGRWTKKNEQRFLVKFKPAADTRPTTRTMLKKLLAGVVEDWTPEMT
ncbi:hypothetical protein PMZ80_008167 [Knufia obscura]|uniref:Uncharacterized protein n=1 Tax=Knufia obscura TaxID=1635080 RepID=A0ABR0RHQ9_9EURO|nr:hypothetical protein PMZ80_008167 [Knufia obscura]